MSDLAAELDVVDADAEVTRTLYIQRHGAVLRCRRGELVVTLEDEEVLAVPSALVDTVVCIGEVGLTPDARTQLLGNGVLTVFLNAAGRPIGGLRGLTSLDGDLLRTQVLAAENPDYRLRLAQGFVLGKLRNMSVLLRRFGTGAAVATAADRIDEFADQLPDVGTIDQLLGTEGAASAAYFEAFPAMLPAWCGFERRNRRPPTDPANAALGFTYALLTGAATGAVVAARLEPSIGFLHDIDGDRPSLALDLMEEFRPLLADQVVLEAFRKESLRPEHFRDGDEPGSVYLTADGRRLIIGAYEERVHQPFRYRPMDRTVNYQRAIFLQAQQLSLLLRRKSTDYRPVLWRS